MECMRHYQTESANSFGPNSNDSMAAASRQYSNDVFCYVVEGFLILVVGSLGLVGNSCSLFLFARQKVHRIFHNLLFLLAIFDLIYVTSSILLFSISKFSSVYDKVFRIYMLPFLLPLAHIGLMGSIYCTLALTIERYIAVCHPFLPHRRVYSSRTFILPVIFLTLLYNIPKFFELYVKEEFTKLCFNGTDNYNLTINASMINEKHNECETESIIMNADDMPAMKISISPTDFRTNRIYIRVYILWMNLIILIILPFVLLFFLNLQIYKKIKTFEQNLFAAHLRVCFTSSTKKKNGTDLQMNTRQSLKSTRDAVGRHEMIQNVNQSSRSPNLQPLLEMEGENADEPNQQATTNAHEQRNGSKHSRKSVLRSNRASGSIGRGSTTSSTTTHPAVNLRKREVVLAKISLSIVFVFFACHGIRLFPNTFEMVQTYMADYHPENVSWPIWVFNITNLSHFLLTFACSGNFFIYFAMHSQNFRRMVQLPMRRLFNKFGSTPSKNRRNQEFADGDVEVIDGDDEVQGLNVTVTADIQTQVNRASPPPHMIRIAESPLKKEQEKRGSKTKISHSTSTLVHVENGEVQETKN